MKNMYAGAVVISMTFAAYVTGAEKQPETPSLTSQPSISTAFAAMTLEKQQTSVADPSPEKPSLSFQESCTSLRVPTLEKPQSLLDREREEAEQTKS